MNRLRTWELEEIIDAYEARRESDEVDVRTFFLPEDHPDFARVAVELIRVELERAWAAGDRDLVARYQTDYPTLFGSTSLRQEIAFEEYRLRCLDDASVRREEYRDRFDVDVADWPHPSTLRGDLELNLEPLPTSLRRSPSDLAGSVGSNLAADFQAEPGDRLNGFEFITVLGKGSFSRVYLARQDSLAHRFVVLKASNARWKESDVLARLQHANIVPIHSIHHIGQTQLVCMPFLGWSTLEDVLNWTRGRAEVREMPSAAALLSTITHRQADTLSESVADGAVRREIRERLDNGILQRRDESFRALNYSEMCLWLASEIADGLAHAHSAGVMHGDLKPANILITDDGRPMLLDFNLSRRIVADEPADQSVGGTLPYMSPEQLRGMIESASIDARSDLYSLGMILYELLAGGRPFDIAESARGMSDDKSGASPSTSTPRRDNVDSLVRRTLANRRQAPPSLAVPRPDLPVGIISIVDKCLAVDPSDRYPSAAALRDDLNRQRNHQPLVHAPNRSLGERMLKWGRRHPTWTAAGAISLLAITVVSGLMASWLNQRQHRFSAAAQVQWQEFHSTYAEARPQLGAPDVHRSVREAGLELAMQAVEMYPSEPPLRSQRCYRLLTLDQQQAVRQESAELMYLLATAEQRRAEQSNDANERKRRINLAYDWNRRARQRAPRAIVAYERQHAELSRALDRSQPIPVASAISRPYLQGLRALWQRDYRVATSHLDEAIIDQPRDFAAWFARGNAYAGVDDLPTATACFTVCTALRPDSPLAFFQRGICRLTAGDDSLARDDFTRAIERDPSLAPAYVNRALAARSLGQDSNAISDLSEAIALGTAETRVYLIRSECYRRLGNLKRAAADEAKGMSLTPTDELSWVARGMRRLPHHPTEALADIEQALLMNPAFHIALINSAHILSEYLGRTEEAIERLDTLMSARPQRVEWIAARGVLLARLGRAVEARQSARQALQKKQDAQTRIHVACIYAQLARDSSADRERALQLVHLALAADPEWVQVVSTDHDLKPLRDDNLFRAWVVKAKHQLETLAEHESAQHNTP